MELGFGQNSIWLEWLNYKSNFYAIIFAFNNETTNKESN